MAVVTGTTGPRALHRRRAQTDAGLGGAARAGRACHWGATGRGPRWPARPTSTVRSRPREPPRGPLGQDAAERARPPAAGPRRRDRGNRKELAELEARNVGKAISSVKAEIAGAAENFRWFAPRRRSIAGRSNPIGGSLLFVLVEGAGRRRRADRPVELPAAHGDMEALARPRRRAARSCSSRIRRRRSSVLRVAELADGGRVSGGRDQHRSRGRADDRRVPRQVIQASTRSRSPARRRPAARSCGSAPIRSSA